MKTAILLFAPVITLSLVGCQQTSDDYPCDLQAKLAHLLDEQTQCASGTSTDVQALVKAAGPDGVVHIPAGCYEITDAVGISAGTQGRIVRPSSSVVHPSSLPPDRASVSELRR